MLAMLGVNPEIKPIVDDEVLVAIVGTNQSRKNWSLGLKACAMLAKHRKVRVWAHIDRLEGYWSLPSLLVDYWLLDKTLISTGFVSDSKMASAYSAADVSLGIGPEGFGFCVGESMACGTPCITGSYANGASLVDPGMVVEPIGFYEEGSFGSVRPVYKAEDWAAKIEEWIGEKAHLDDKYDWAVNWISWDKYLREAAK